MPHLRALLRAGACAACLLASTARADDALASAGPLAPQGGGVSGPDSSVPSAPSGRRRHQLGLQIDAGFPDGGAASVLYRPLSFLRLDGGLLYNYAGYGVRGGFTILPYFPIAPSLSLEVGHYFDANAAAAVSRFTTVSDSVRPLLERVGYTFVDAQVGLELGHPDWFVFFVRAGLSRVWLSVHNAQAAAQQSSAGGTTVSHMDDPSVRLSTPDVKVGFILFFY